MQTTEAINRRFSHVRPVFEIAMRIAKALVGWLAFLSLVASTVAVGVYLYSTIVPFFRGAALYELAPPDPSKLTSSLAESGIRRPDIQSVLRKYTHGEAPVASTITGWDAVAVRFSRIGAVSKSSERHNVAAVALFDDKMNMVAANPLELKQHTFGSKNPVSQMEDSPSAGKFPYWRSVFARTAALYAEDVGDVYMNRVMTPDGRTIGLLVTAARSAMVLDMPGRSELLYRSDTEAAGILAILAIISFGLYWLLLTAWVAMDARWRGMRPSAWAILLLVTNLIGLGAYLIARLPAPSKCPNCGELIFGKYVRCPACGVSLRPAICPICRSPMRPGWQYCPVCSGIASRPAEAPRTASVSEPTQPPAAQRAGLRVDVVDDASGAPISGTRITIKGPCAIEGLTSGQGTFEARRVRSGKYSITAAREGYEPAKAELEIAEDSPEDVQLRLRSMPGRIIGRVVERASQKPLTKANVCLDTSRVDRSAVTEADGGFVLADVPPGPYTVRAEAEGFAPQSRLIAVVPGQQTAVDFALEQTAETAES